MNRNSTANSTLQNTHLRASKASMNALSATNIQTVKRPTTAAQMRPNALKTVAYHQR